jgi:hypothetical protein
MRCFFKGFVDVGVPHFVVRFGAAAQERADGDFFLADVVPLVPVISIRPIFLA